MRISLLVFLSLSLSLGLLAEGTREVAPNANIVITGSNTTDIAALLIGNSEYNNFAFYGNPDPNSRLYIHIADPANECVFLGFSFGHANANGTNPPRINYEYRVRDPNGNIVFGPVTVPTAGGNIQNWSQAHTGPMQIYGAGGYNAMQITPSDLQSQGWSGAGDFFIEFSHPTKTDGLLIDFWDISVSNCSVAPLAEQKGRVWSYNWAIFAINDFGFPIRPFNGAFYVCAPDPDNVEAAFITKIDFNGAGFRPAAFNVAFNSFGSQNTGDVMFDRRSVEAANTTQAEYSVFLNDPVDLCQTAEPGEIELLGVSRCGTEDYCIKFFTSREGQIDLLLDFDGPDDIYTPGTADKIISIQVGPENVGIPSCVSWDGKDGLGNFLPENVNTSIPVVISFAQGIYHFPIYDAEFMTAGVSVEAIRPTSPKPLLYYDDTNISVASGSGEPAVQLTGCVTPCHRWTVFNDANIPGFGNLNTINSWWFSQRIVKSEVFFMPSYLSCNVVGPDKICEGETTALSWQALAEPTGSDVPEVIGSLWSGPAILSSNEEPAIIIGGGGIYTVDIQWLSLLGDTCSSTCEIQVQVDPTTYGSIDTLIVKGESIEINGEAFDEGGQYTQVLIGTNGCDSILTIDITVLQTVVHYDLDACISVPSNGSDAVYTEFAAAYPEPLACASIQASIAYRENPMVNKHSCTPGVEDSPAICVSSLDSCTYSAGDEKSFVFELTVTPATDTAVAVTGLTFYERAPEMFDWIGGTTGPNNYPTLYGLRILKDGVEIYREVDIATTTDWTLEVFDFLGLDEFIVDATATFQFELLGYCLIGNGAMVPAWDVDEIKVMASCVSPGKGDGMISGRVLTEFGQKITDVDISISDEPTFTDPIISMSDQNGQFTFSELPAGDQFYLKGYKNNEFLNGVSTLDLIKMQKHLLGLQAFDSPLQYIAADVTGNQSVSALDIVHLRKLILGVYQELPNNTSWRFGDPDQNLSLSNPWLFEETVAISRQAFDQENVNLLAVKIGDVNRSISNIASEVEARSASCHWYIPEQFVKAGDLVSIEVTNSDELTIHGFQCAFLFDGAIVEKVIDGVLNIAETFALHAEDTELRMSWSTGAPQQLPKGEVLFTVSLRTQRDGFISELIQLDKQGLNAEAYVGDDGEIFPLRLNIERQETEISEVTWIQNTPNPFSTQTDIQFFITEPGDVIITVYSATGALIYKHQDIYGSGMHTLTLCDQQLGETPGVLFCQFRNGSVIETRKMIRMK